MELTHKIRNIRKYLKHIPKGESFYLAFTNAEAMEDRTPALGLSYPLAPGERVLPSARFGPATLRNAEGYDIVHKDKPKEIASRQMEWRWTEFRGRYDREERSKIVDVPYERYPRTAVPPYSVELEVKLRADGTALIVAGPFPVDGTRDEAATNTANMLFETLGAFEVLRQNLAAWIDAPVRRLNWQVLPHGRNPWESALPMLEEAVNRQPEGNRPVLLARLQAVGQFDPDFVAVGVGGFDGYTVFGFSQRGLCVLESPHTNNATYLLPMNSWETISQMSKAEILDANVHLARIIHKEGWFSALGRALRQAA